MVRVANPVSGDVHNIAFSHLQTWYEPQQVAVREKQFAIAKDLFTSSLVGQLHGIIEVVGAHDVLHAVPAREARQVEVVQEVIEPHLVNVQGPSPQAKKLPLLLPDELKSLLHSEPGVAVTWFSPGTLRSPV
jgi:hypothetical protein